MGAQKWAVTIHSQRRMSVLCCALTLINVTLINATPPPPPAAAAAAAAAASLDEPG